MTQITLKIENVISLCDKVIAKAEHDRKEAILEDATASLKWRNRLNKLFGREQETVLHVYNDIKNWHPAASNYLELELQAKLVLFYIKHNTSSSPDITLSFDTFVEFMEYIGEGISQPGL